MQVTTTRTQKRNSDVVERWTRRAAHCRAPQQPPQTTPKESALTCTISPLITKRSGGRSLYSISHPKAFQNGIGNTGQLCVKNVSEEIKTTTTLPCRPRTRSPDDWRHSTGQILNCVPEDAEMSAEEINVTRRSETTSTRKAQKYYGSTSVTGYPALLEMDHDSELGEEEEGYLLDEELAKSGLYKGNYKTIVLLYTFVPLTTLITFVILAFLPVFALRSSTQSAFPYPPYLPFPLPEVFTSAALWSLSHLLRDLLYGTSLSLTSWLPNSSRRFPDLIPSLTSLLAALLQNTSALVLRQLSVPLLLVPLYSTEKPLFDDGKLYNAHSSFPTWEDVAFKRVWWIALGWAAAEAVLGIKQGYENIALYKDVFVSVRKTIQHETPTPTPRIPSADAAAEIGQAGTSNRDRVTQKWSERRGTSTDREAETSQKRRDHSRSLSSIASGSLHDDVTHERQPLLTLRRQPTDTFMGTGAVGDANKMVESIVEQDLEELLRLKTMEEIEELYGMPVIRIPVFISCLHRINSILASLAGCLILTAAYMRSTFAYDYSSASLRSPLQLFFPPTRTFHPAIESSHPFNDQHQFNPSNRDLIASFTVLLGVHTVFSVLHAPWILPRIGVHTFVYVNFLVWLGLFFSALGFWEVLS